MHRRRETRARHGRAAALAAAALALALLAPAAPARGDEELDALLARIPAESSFGRSRLIERVAELGTPEAVRSLIDFFRDDELRWMAVRQVARLRGAAVPELAAALASPNADVVRFAAYALGEIRDPGKGAAAGSLAVQLRPAHPVRRAENGRPLAAEGFRDRHGVGALPRLDAYLPNRSDPDREVLAEWPCQEPRCLWQSSPRLRQSRAWSSPSHGFSPGCGADPPADPAA